MPWFSREGTTRSRPRARCPHQLLTSLTLSVLQFGVSQLFTGRTSGFSSLSEFQALDISVLHPNLISLAIPSPFPITLSFLERISAAEWYTSTGQQPRQMTSRLVSVFGPSLSNVSQPHGDQSLSSDKLSAFRDFFNRRPDDRTIDARKFSICPDLGNYFHDSGSFCEDAASDLAEYGDSVQYHTSSHGHGNFRDNLTSAPVSMRTDTLIQGCALIGTIGTKHGDLLSALSVTRAESEHFVPDNAPLLAEGDTFLNLSGDPSRSVSKS